MNTKPYLIVYEDSTGRLSSVSTVSSDDMSYVDVPEGFTSVMLELEQRPQLHHTTFDASTETLIIEEPE